MSMDIARINEYNAKLKAAKEQSSKLKSEIEYSTRELNRLCAELSQSLGEEVNINNIEEVYKRETEKIEKTLQVGEEILGRITGNPVNSAPVSQAPVNNGFTAPANAAPVETPQAPVQSTGNFGGSTGVNPFMQAAQKHNAEVKQSELGDEFGFEDSVESDNVNIGTIGDISGMFGNLGI